MHKRSLTALLPPETKRKLEKTLKSKGIAKRYLFIEAVAQFKEKVKTSGKYKIKHQNIDRIYDSYTTFITFETTKKELDKLAKIIELSRKAVIREIICEYFSNK